jgi:hypothetical protein
MGRRKPEETRLIPAVLSQADQCEAPNIPVHARVTRMNGFEMG